MMCFGLKDRKRLKTNHCVIVLLDDTQLVHELHPNSSGQDLLDVVIKHLNLLETSYFGLKYYPDGAAPSNGVQGDASSSQAVWLDMERSAIKQLREANPMTVHFGVKYYATDPCKLAEEITRYQFFLQCKQDILANRLAVSFELAIELFGLAIQSELGDYDPARHLENYASEFQFVQHQTLELEQRAALYHRQLVGQVPATAELNFLEKVKWLDLYGCQLHLIQYDDGAPRSRHEPGDLYALGLNPSGVLVLRNRLKVAQYFWARIVKTKCQGRCFLMDVIESGGASGLLTTTSSSSSSTSGASGSLNASGKRNRFGFRLADKEASRRLRWAIEEHKNFYHLIHSTASFNQLARHQRHQQQQQHQQLQAHEQRLRNSIKSLNQHLQTGAARPPPMVVRTPSRRYSNRSLPRPLPPGSQQQLAYGASQRAANGNGLPQVGLSSTMNPSQRQQAMLMMASNQQQQQHFQQHASGYHLATRSHTLRPISSKEAKQRGYYQMMLAAGQQQQQQHQQLVGDHQRAPLAEVSILQAGQHIVQPSIYRATSVVDGINQLADLKAPQQHQHQLAAPPMMQQFFNTRPQAPRRASGHESPRSTKSAMAPSSAMKLASKRLAKQQFLRSVAQQHNSQDSSDVRPLLDYAEPVGAAAGRLAPPDPMDVYYANAPQYGPGSSPRAAYGYKSASSGLSRSRSTGENLHLVHQRHQQQAVALRAAVANSKMLLTTVNQLGGQHHHHHNHNNLHRHHTLLPPPDYNSGSELNGAKLDGGQQRHRMNSASGGNKPSKQAVATLSSDSRGAKPFEAGQDDYNYCSRSDCSSIDEDGDGGRQLNASARGKARQARFINGRLVNVGELDPNNNQLSGGGGGALAQPTGKSIANKQATPILLSMANQTEAGKLAAGSQLDHARTNSRAVQLLNSQRQHLQHAPGANTLQQVSGQLEGKSRPALGSSGSDSVNSSAASSPHFETTGQANNRRRHHNAADSTGSSSTTTSGYYAGSNSTEPASVDSDSGGGGGGGGAGSRAKIALSLHGQGGARRLAGMKVVASRRDQQEAEQQMFSYQADGRLQDESELGQRQNGPPSLKYVSFDV